MEPQKRQFWSFVSKCSWFKSLLIKVLRFLHSNSGEHLNSRHRIVVPGDARGALGKWVCRVARRHWLLWIKWCCCDFLTDSKVLQCLLLSFINCPSPSQFPGTSCLCSSLQINDIKDVKQVEFRVGLKNTKHKPPKCKRSHLNCSLCVFITVFPPNLAFFISLKYIFFFFQPSENVQKLRYLEMFLSFPPWAQGSVCDRGNVCVRAVAGLLQPLCVLMHKNHI